jgi:hypothetical protein
MGADFIGMDYARIFAITISAVLAGNALTFAMVWAMRYMTSHEARRKEAKDAPVFVLLTMVLVFAAAGAGVFLTFTD